MLNITSTKKMLHCFVCGGWYSWNARHVCTGFISRK